MARIVAIAPDLMFASKIAETLAAAGHEVTICASVSEAQPEDAELLIADLDRVDPAAVTGLGPPVLGFYPHTDAELRQRAEAAGVDLVVPRSRMAREMPQLVKGLLERA
jgi:NAD(P)-dependent dehydrogenase (short-subunit alcohol dehydrogenase family)